MSEAPSDAFLNSVFFIIAQFLFFMLMLFVQSTISVETALSQLGGLYVAEFLNHWPCLHLC